MEVGSGSVSGHNSGDQNSSNQSLNNSEQPDGIPSEQLAEEFVSLKTLEFITGIESSQLKSVLNIQNEFIPMPQLRDSIKTLASEVFEIPNEE